MELIRWNFFGRILIIAAFIFLSGIGNHLTESSDKLALIEKKDCEEDLGRMGCTGITSTCEFDGPAVMCNCFASNCTKELKSKVGTEFYDDNDIAESGNSNSVGFTTSTKLRLPPGSKLGSNNGKVGRPKKPQGWIDHFFTVLNREFRLRYGLEGIGTSSGFIRLGFCKVPLETKRNDVCFFMHWFLDNGFKQLNVRFGHRVTNSSAASV